MELEELIKYKDFIFLFLIPFLWKIINILVSIKFFIDKSIKTDQEHEKRITLLEQNCKVCKE